MEGVLPGHSEEIKRKIWYGVASSTMAYAMLSVELLMKPGGVQSPSESLKKVPLVPKRWKFNFLEENLVVCHQFK